jgi:HAD superfamily hydrolase (TIGR01549 family)
MSSKREVRKVLRPFKRLVCFDLDGVLLDSRQNMQLAWSAVRAELDITVGFERYFAEIGRPFGEIMTILGLEAEAEAIETVFRQASRASLHETPLYEGVGDMLLALNSAGVKLAIVTSKDRTRTDLVLSRLPVTFQTVQTPDGICRGKPAPDHLLMAMATCRTDPADTVFIGDMDADAEAAARAGIDYIHAAWGYGRPPKRRLASLDSCAALMDFLLPAETEYRIA